MTDKLKTILVSMMLVVISVLMLPTVITSVTSIMTTDNLSDYTGTSSMVKLIPLLVTIGIIIVAVVNTMFAFKKKD